MNTFAEQELRRASWREIASRASLDGDDVPWGWIDDARPALTEAADLLPLTELGELLMACRESDPAHWDRMLPLVVVVKLAEIRRARGEQ